jgi:hypothetical protein
MEPAKIIIVVGGQEAIPRNLLDKLYTEYGDDLKILSPEQAKEIGITNVTIKNFPIRSIDLEIAPLLYASEEVRRPWINTFDNKLIKSKEYAKKKRGIKGQNKNGNRHQMGRTRGR